MAPISQRWWRLFRNLEPTCFKDNFWSGPGHHVGRFRMILGSMLMDLGIIFDGFWLLLCSSICRMSKPPGTKRNSGKHQEHADNCRNMQTSSARKNKSPNSDRDTASCRMQIAATNANLQIRGRRCSRRMAHSDPPTPSLDGGARRAR